MHKFIENIIGFSLKNHVFILFMTGVLFVAGIAPATRILPLRLIPM